MYSTVRDIYTNINVNIQNINSNRKRNITEPELDIIFNRNLLRFVNNRISGKVNVKKEGYEDTTKRVSDLHELKRSTSPINTIALTNTLSYIPLPSDFIEFESGVSNGYYNCNKFNVVNTLDEVYIAKLKFNNNQTPVTDEYYKDFKLTIVTTLLTTLDLFTVNDYVNFEKSYDTESKFMLINAILNLRLNDIQIYWESYNGEFESNTFFLVTKNKLYLRAALQYNNVLTLSNFIDGKYIKYESETNFNSTLELVPSNKFNSLADNYYYSKNRHLKPLCKIENNRLYILSDNTFINNNIILSYISKPIFICYFTDTMTNLRTNIKEVIDMTVEDISAILKADYQENINKNIKIE